MTDGPRGDTYEEYYQNMLSMVNKLLELGFLIHPRKSQWIPSQVVEILGFIVNLVAMTVSVKREDQGHPRHLPFFSSKS